MRIDAPEGTKVRYLNQNGYDGDREYANKYLKEGQIYEVEFTVIHSWLTDVFLKGIPVSFNSVMFEEVEDELVSGVQN